MMFTVSGDIKFIYSSVSSDTLGPADIDTHNRDTLSDKTFETAALITLGTNSRAKDTDILPATYTSRGGFWGSAVAGYAIGNRLWLLNRSKLTQDTAQQAKSILEEGYAWFVEEGIASSVEATTSIQSPQRLNMRVLIERPKKYTVTFSFFANWEAQLIGAM